MLNKNFQHLFDFNNYQFYRFEEIGFSSGKLALQHNLYEDFGEDFVSRFYEIFHQREHTEQKISQIWITKNSMPIGLGLVVHEDEPYFIQDKKNDLATFCLGHIQLFIALEHRRKGLAAKMVPLLEDMIATENTYYPPSIIMQDNAYMFKDYLKKSIAVPYPKDSIDKFKNETFLFEAFKNIGREHCLFNTYPDFFNKINHSIIDNNSSSFSNSLAEKFKALRKK